MKRPVNPRVDPISLFPIHAFIEPPISFPANLRFLNFFFPYESPDLGVIFFQFRDRKASFWRFFFPLLLVFFFSPQQMYSSRYFFLERRWCRSLSLSSLSPFRRFFPTVSLLLLFQWGKHCTSTHAFFFQPASLIVIKVPSCVFSGQMFAFFPLFFLCFE